MNGISFGSASLKMTRPTVVLMIWLSTSCSLGLQHVLRVARDRQIDEPARVAQPDRRQRLDLARLEREQHVVDRRERAALALGARPCDFVR